MGSHVGDIAVGAPTRRRWRVKVSLAIVAMLVTAACDGPRTASDDGPGSPGPVPEGSSAAAGPAPGLSWPEYLDDLVELLRAAHPDGDTIDWAATRAELRLDEVASPASAYVAAARLVAALDDPHNRFFDAASLQHQTDDGPSPAGPSGELRDGSVAYIELPASRPGNEGYERYVEAAREVLDQHHDACGWIIDLRSNTGGDVFVVLQGIAPLLGDGTVLEVETRYGTPEITVDEDAVFVDGIAVAHVDEWALRDLLHEDSRIVDEVPAEGLVTAYAAPAGRVPDGSAPVAVLFGEATASAGEITAIALQGRPGPLRTFGAPTYGAPTGTTSYGLVDGSGLRLTTALMTDRTGTTHRESLQPDEPDDAPARAAQAWLQRHGCG